MEILIAIALVLSRFYMIYWMYQGIREVKLSNNRNWSLAYVVALAIYIGFASISSLNGDLHNPLRLIGSIAGGIIITILVRVIRRRSKD